LICQHIDDGELFECAGNRYAMLIPRDQTRCLEAVLETVMPGGSTPPNAHETFVQLYVLLAGSARLRIGSEIREVQSPSVAFIPKQTVHCIENTGGVPLRYLYVSIWPGAIPAEEDRPWREICARMIADYAERGFPNGPSPATDVPKGGYSSSTPR
jgi:mannose-6-phosphate isomerase-like protein (cupin superfamily)